MLSLEQCRGIDPNLKNVPDDELAAALTALYGFGELAMEEFRENQRVPKIPFGLQLDSDNCGTL